MGQSNRKVEVFGRIVHAYKVGYTKIGIQVEERLRVRLNQGVKRSLRVNEYSCHRFTIEGSSPHGAHRGEHNVQAAFFT